VTGETPSEQGPRGLGGWLILVAIGLVIAPLRMTALTVTDLVPIITGGYWSALTDPTSPTYHPLWAPLLILEGVGNTVFSVFAAILLVLFFQRSRRFPGLMVAYLVSSLLFVTADYFVAELIPVVAAQDDVNSTRELGRAAVASLIWIPYFRRSRRVRNTFVEPAAADPGPAPAT